MFPSTDLSRLCPFTHGCVVNERAISQAEAAHRVVNVQLEYHLFFKGTLEIQYPLTYEPYLLMPRAS